MGFPDFYENKGASFKEAKKEQQVKGTTYLKGQGNLLG